MEFSLKTKNPWRSISSCNETFPGKFEFDQAQEQHIHVNSSEISFTYLEDGMVKRL